MSYFPFFIELKEKKGVIVGAGIVACRKVEKLLPYAPSLTVISPEICDELDALRKRNLFTYKQRKFQYDDLADADFVIAATDDAALNHGISEWCKKRNVLVNVVDDAKWCSFYFPSLVKRGKLSIGISTEGASPSAAIYMRKQIEAMVPEHMEEILDYLCEKREEIKASYETEAERSKVLKQLFLDCLQSE